jgi:CDP-4-dehydro-6-deoxyglucose reductase, E1
MKKKEMRVPYALTVYGKEEIEAVNRVLKDPTKIVTGPAVREFEKKISQIFGKKHGLMVNSGSSANLLAIDILDMPNGSEVITPILTFATTVAPIVQKGLVPVFVDVVTGTYQIDIDQIEKLITKKN